MEISDIATAVRLFRTITSSDVEGDLIVVTSRPLASFSNLDVDIGTKQPDTSSY